MNPVVYVVYRYFPSREGVEIVKVFRNEDHAEAFKKELPTEVAGQMCNIYVQKADFIG